MKLRILNFSENAKHLFAGAHQIATSFTSTCQFVRVGVIVCVEAIGCLERGNGFPISMQRKEKITELMIRLETLRVLGNSSPEHVFRLAVSRFGCDSTDRRLGFFFFQGDSTRGESFGCSPSCLRAMSAKICSIN